MNLPSDLVLRFYELAERSVEELARKASSTVIQYVGNLDEPFANALTSRLEKLLEDELKSKRVRKRFFNAYIEIIQNIRLHGIKDAEDHIHAGLIVYFKSNKLCADFLNIVSKKQADLLTSRYREINSLSAEKLKKLYLDIMLHGEISLKGGGGLGIITVVMKTKNPSVFDLTELDEDYMMFRSRIQLDIE